MGVLAVSIPTNFLIPEPVTVFLTEEADQILQLSKLGTEAFGPRALTPASKHGALHRRHSNATQGWRVVLLRRYENGSRVRPRFSLAKRAAKKTFETMATFFDREGLEWSHFVDDAGHPLKGSRYSSKAQAFPV